VVYLQFYLVRLLDVSFEVGAILLAILNLPVFYSMRFAKFSLPDRRAAVLRTLALIVVIVSFVPQFLKCKSVRMAGKRGCMLTQFICSLPVK
jgi:hypothetical protein